MTLATGAAALTLAIDGFYTAAGAVSLVVFAVSVTVAFTVATEVPLLAAVSLATALAAASLATVAFTSGV